MFLLVFSCVLTAKPLEIYFYFFSVFYRPEFLQKRTPPENTDANTFQSAKQTTIIPPIIPLFVPSAERMFSPKFPYFLRSFAFQYDPLNKFLCHLLVRIWSVVYS